MNIKSLKTIREIIVRNMVIVNYDKKWPDDFLKIKEQVQKCLQCIVKCSTLAVLKFLE